MRKKLNYGASRTGLGLLTGILLVASAAGTPVLADEPAENPGQPTTEAAENPANTENPADTDPETPQPSPLIPDVNPNGPNVEEGDPDDVPPTPTPGVWKCDTDGWWYEFSEGGYAQNEWVYIGTDWYLFGPDGYMLTGWQQYDNKWYYLGMKTGKWIDYNKYEENTIKGVDVSYWQSDVDWTAFKAAGIDFAFIRAGYGTSKSHGNNDSCFIQNVDGANAAGIAAGVYYYSTAMTVSQAILDARFVISRMQGHTISYPVAIDMEDDKTQGQLSKEQNARIARAFCDEIAAAGYTPMIYCNENWYNNYIDMAALSDIDTWVARFDIRHSDDIDVDIWQSSSTTMRPDKKNYDSGNRIDPVDVSFGYKNYREIITPRTQSADDYDINRKVLCTDDNGTWLFLPDGSYAQNSIQLYNDAYYYFNGDGYMTTGWQYVNQAWYYFKEDGRMAVDEWIDGCYLDTTGKWDPSIKNPDADEDEDTDNTPEQRGEWRSSGSRWWYRHDDASYTTNGWEKIGGKWYYFDADGWMKTGWIKDGSTWYYLDDDGAMKTGWFYVKGIWYYTDKKGMLATSTWVDDYYVNADGAWVAVKTSKGASYNGTWKQSGNRWWYQHTDGSYAKNGWELISDEWYFFDADGWMKTGWVKDGSTWYYLGDDGAMKTDTWIGGYYVDETGAWLL